MGKNVGDEVQWEVGGLFVLPSGFPQENCEISFSEVDLILFQFFLQVSFIICFP